MRGKNITEKYGKKEEEVVAKENIDVVYKLDLTANTPLSFSSSHEVCMRSSLFLSNP